MNELRRIDRYLRTLRPWSPRFVLVCAVPALFVALVLGSHRLPAYVELVSVGATATGTITAVQCGRHPSFDYRFDAGGREERGSGRPRTLQVECAQLRVGQQVPVIYASGDPRVSEATPRLASTVAREAGLVAGLSILAFAGCALVLSAASRRSV